MNKDEALKLALEWMEAIVNSNWRNWEELTSPEEFERWVKSRANHSAVALRQALAQPEQSVDLLLQSAQEGWRWAKECEAEVRRLQALSEQPKQEPLAFVVIWEVQGSKCHRLFGSENEALSYAARSGHTGSIEPLYTAPPSKEFVQLNDKDIDDAWLSLAFLSNKGLVELRHDYARAIEAKLKELNHG